MEGFDERRFQYRFFNKYERDDFKLTQYGYHRWSKETAHAPTIKDSYVLHIVLEGKGFVRVKNKQYQVFPGNAFLIRPGELIDYYSDKNNIWSYIWLGVEGNSAEEFFFRYGFDEFNYVLPLTGVDELRAIIADMFSRPQTNAPDLYTVAKTYEFLSCFASKIATFKRKSEAKYSDNLNKVVEYIHRNYYRDLSITEICEKFGFERSTLYRMFKREFGVSTQEYILIYRLEVADNCITHTSMSFKTIAVECGFNNYAHFSGSFKRYKGVSPKEYREQTEKQKLLQINKNQ